MVRDWEVISVAVIVLIGSFWLAGLTWWVIFLTGFAGWLALVEAYLWRTRRETLSSQFWKFREKHKEIADLLLLVIAFFTALLVLHLRA